jgi:hypothetical protein
LQRLRGGCRGLGFGEESGELAHHVREVGERGHAFPPGSVIRCQPRRLGSVVEHERELGTTLRRLDRGGQLASTLRVESLLACARVV